MNVECIKACLSVVLFVCHDYDSEKAIFSNFLL